MSWGVGNGRYTGDEFICELNKMTPSSLVSFTGLAKPSETDSGQQILFTQTAKDDSWVGVPVKLLEFVDVLGAVILRSKRYSVVRLSFEKPTGADGVSIISDLIEQREISINDGTLPFGLALRSDGTLPFGLTLRGDGTLPFGLTLRSDGTLPFGLTLRGDGTLSL